MDNADTATVIVNYRTKELTAEAVRSVASEPAVREIVVVDNASGDGSAAYLRETLTDPRVRVVESESNVGFGQGVNIAARHCTAPLLLLLNSDAALIPGSLPILARTLLEDPAVAIVAPAIYDTDSGNLQSGAHGVFPTLRAILLRINRRPPETISPEWVSGAAMLLRRRDFEAIGGFDSDFHMYLEDVDLCRRFRLAGKEIRRELAAGVLHVRNQSWNTDSFTVTLRHAQQSRVTFFRKAGYSAGERLAVELIRWGHMFLQKSPLHRSFPRKHA